MPKLSIVIPCYNEEKVIQKTHSRIALFSKLFGRAVPGWTSMVVPLYFLGGIQLLFLGILGEYVGEIYLETKKRPPFIISEKINFDEKNK